MTWLRMNSYVSVSYMAAAIFLYVVSFRRVHFNVTRIHIHVRTQTNAQHEERLLLIHTYICISIFVLAVAWLHCESALSINLCMYVIFQCYLLYQRASIRNPTTKPTTTWFLTAFDKWKKIEKQNNSWILFLIVSELIDLFLF